MAVRAGGCRPESPGPPAARHVHPGRAGPIADPTRPRGTTHGKPTRAGFEGVASPAITEARQRSRSVLDVALTPPAIITPRRRTDRLAFRPRVSRRIVNCRNHCRSWCVSRFVFRLVLSLGTGQFVGGYLLVLGVSLTKALRTVSRMTVGSVLKCCFTCSWGCHG